MFVLCGVLLAAIAVFFAACKNSEQEQEKLLTDVKAETAVLFRRSLWKEIFIM